MNAFRAVLLLVLFAAPVMAQGRGQPPTSDTVIVRRTSAGFLVNFDDQPLRVVFSALAEASGLNIVQTNIPLRNTTLHMGTAVSRDQMLDVIKGLAASNNVTVIEGPSLVRLEGPAPSPTTTQQQLAAQQAAAQAAQQQLYIYRLKHASAVQLAPVLQGLFAGITRQPTAAQLAAQNPLAALIGLAGGGRAGRGGEEIAINVPATAVPPTPTQPGRGGNPGRGNQQQAAQQQAALSASAADIRIQAEESSNSLLIRATAADYQLITQVLSGVDLRPLQVLIEVMIAEVTRTRDLNVGVTVNDVSNSPKTENGTTVRGSQQSLATARDFILQLTGGRGGVNFDVALNALQSRGDVRVLSMPVIIAENNREAILNVGSSRPFVQVSQSALGGAGGVVETVQYIDVGTVLTITPTINPDGYVNLQVQQTANSATNEIQFNAPVINKREATTQVFIRDGQTTVIGGLADNVQSNNSSGIPGLSRIPGLGWLFGNKQRTRTASELFLFLTPHVIFTDTDVDKLREAVKANSELLQTVPIEARIKPRGDTITVKLPPRPDTIRKPPAR
jgi:general secretion pathway protein D